MRLSFVEFACVFLENKENGLAKTLSDWTAEPLTPLATKSVRRLA